MKYITTDMDSDYALESGKRYLADFDVSRVPDEVRSVVPLEYVKYKLINALRERGHELENVTVMVPQENMVRVYFTPKNPPPLWLLVMLGVAIIGAAVTGTAYVASSLHVLFVGIAEALQKLVVIPVTIFDSAMKNPIAVIAIIVAVGLFLMRSK